MVFFKSMRCGTLRLSHTAVAGTTDFACCDPGRFGVKISAADVSEANVSGTEDLAAVIGVSPVDVNLVATLLHECCLWILHSDWC